MNEILIILHTADNSQPLIDSGMDLANNLGKKARFVYPVGTAEFGYYPPHGDPGTFPGDLTYNEALEKEKAIVRDIINKQIEKKTANLFPAPEWKLDVLLGKPDVVLPDYLKNLNLAFILTKPADPSDSKTLKYNVESYLKSQSIPVLINSTKNPLHKMENVLFATDMHPKDAALVKDLLDRVNRKITLTLLHVAEKNKSEEAVDSILTKDMFLEGTHELNQVNIYSEDVAQGIQKHLQRHPADVLVLFRHNKSFWEKLFEKSESKKIMAETETPVLLYHE